MTLADPYVIGDILMADSSTTLTTLHNAPGGNVLLSGGVGEMGSYGKVNLADYITGILHGQHGGTGIDNGDSTITVAGDLEFLGAFSFAGTLVGDTAVTFPTSGTLAVVEETISSITGTEDQVLVNDTFGTPQVGDVTLTLAIVNPDVGSFGDASHSLSIDANANGLITAISTNSIQISESQVTDLVTDLAAKLDLSGGTMLGDLILNGDATTLLQAVTYQQLNAAVVGAYKLQGGYDPTATSLYPVASDTTNPISATILQGMIWSVTVSGSINGNAVTIGDQLVALINAPAQSDSNWSIINNTTNFLPSSNIFVGNISNIAAAVVMSGDIGIDNAGITTIQNLAITNAKIANSTIDLTAKVTGILPASNGGTGVNNGSSTITLGGSLTTSGAYASTFTMTGATSVTFPTSGTLATDLASAYTNGNGIIPLVNSPNKPFQLTSGVRNALTVDPFNSLVTTAFPMQVPNGAEIYQSTKFINSSATIDATYIGYNCISDGAADYILTISATYFSTNADDSFSVMTRGSHSMTVTPDAGVFINGSTSSIVVSNPYTLATFTLQNPASKLWACTFSNPYQSSGDVTLAGENYLSISGQVITANSVNLAGTNVTGTLPNAKTTATNANTASAIVERDSSGNFSAGTITASLSGNATTATTATNVAGGALGSIPYQASSSSTSLLAGNTSATRKFLRQTGTGAVSAAPAWDTIVAGDISGAALTKVDDTNVTLTLGGSPSTALLNAASLTLGWTGTLAAARGGVGLDSSAWAQGDIPYISATGTWNHLAKNASATRYLSNTGTSNNPAWAQIDLTNGVTGILPNANTTAASANTASAIVTRDASGNFIAGNPTFTGLTVNTIVSAAATTLALSSPAPASNVNAVGITIISANGVGSGSSNGGTIAITSGNGSGASGANGGNISITTGNGSSGGLAGTMTVQGGTSTTTGGITNIYGGAGANSSAGGGQLNLIGGAAPGQGTGGNAVLTGGSASTFGTAGDVIITGGASGTSSVAGNVRIRGGIATSGTQGAVIFDQGAVNLNLLSASSLTGTDSGKNVITGALTGDVTTSAFAATIAANVVTYAKFQQVAASSLVGNATGSLANATGITLGTSLTFSGSTINTIQGIRTADSPTFTNLTVSATSANAILNITSTTSGECDIIMNSAGQSNIYMKRASTSFQAFQILRTGASDEWFSGLNSSSNNYVIRDAVNSVDVLTLAQGSGTSSTATFAGGVNVGGLSTSSLVATDSSKNLTSSTSSLSPTFTSLTLSSKIAVGAAQTTIISHTLNLTGADANITGPHIAAYTATDQYPVFQQLNWQHNNIALGFDHYWNGSNWISSSSGSNYQIYKVSNQLQFNYSSGIAAGSTASLTTAGYIDTSGTLNWNKNLTTNAAVLCQSSTADFFFVKYTGTAGSGTQICALGTSSAERFRFYDELTASTLGPRLDFNAGNPAVFSSGGNNIFAFVGGGVPSTVFPTTDNNTTLGKSGNRWSQLWAGTTTINTSDAKTKNSINQTRLGLDFINKLTPREFKFNKGKRVHHGLVAQEVKKVLDDLEIHTNDFAGYVDPKFDDPKDKSPCGLRYSEFISPLIAAIQDLSNRVTQLEMRKAA